MPGTNFAHLAALTTTLLAVAAPAAGAATHEVDPASTIAAALAKAAPGDTLSLKKGVYQEAPLDVTKAGITIEAVPGTVAITSKSTSAGADVLKISATGVTLRGLTIGVQPGGGSAVVIAGQDALIDTSTLINQAKDGADVATLELGAPAGVTTVRNAIVVHAPDLAAPGGAPAVQGAGASSLLLEGTQVVAGPESGPAVALPGNGASANRVVRSGLLALRPDADALIVTSAADSAAAKQTVVDSSVLAGGTGGGAGLRAASAAGSGLGGSNAGTIDVDLFHATIAGAGRSIVVDAAADGRGLDAAPKGSIDVRAERSIVHGPASVQNFDADVPLLSAGNTASLAVVDSDSAIQPSSDSGSTITASGNVSNADSALFADATRRVYLLRPDAPVIDKGGPVKAGESDKDLEGEARLTGAATDLGADEYVNKAPVAKLKVPAQVAQNQQVTIDAGGSADPEGTYGGGLKEYRFDFGDGQTATSSTPQVQHVYPAVGTYAVKVTVVDVAGAVSNVATAALQVTDGIAPTLKIAAPKNGTTFRMKKGRTYRIQGTAQDEAGVQSVEVSFKYGKASGRTCRFLDPKKKTIVGRPCAKPLFFRVALRDGIWAYRTKKTTKLRKGTYLVTVRATDKSGVAAQQRVRFNLK